MIACRGFGCQLVYGQCHLKPVKKQIEVARLSLSGQKCQRFKHPVNSFEGLCGVRLLRRFKNLQWRDMGPAQRQVDNTRDCKRDPLKAKEKE